MIIIKRFISKVFKVLVVLLVFLTLNVTTIKAESTYSDDNIFYAIGSFINSTQKGISKRLNEIEIVKLGKDYARNLIDNGSRMSDIVRVRGNEILFNPHGKMNIVNFVDGAYGAYNDFANYAVSRVEDNRYIVNLNYSGEYSRKNVTSGSVYTHNTAVYLNFGGTIPGVSWYVSNFINVPVDYNNISRFNSATLSYSIFGGKPNENRELNFRHFNKNGIDLSRMHTFRKNQPTPFVIDFTEVGGMAIYPNTFLLDTKGYSSVSYELGTLVFYNEYYQIEEDIVPYNRDDIPTKEDFIVNITKNYDAGNFYAYDFDEILNENTVINNEYIVNNYITVEEFIPKDDEVIEDDEVVEDNLPMLEKILKAIKDLPKDIADKLDFPEGSGEEGGGFWSGLFGAIGDLASAMSDFITGIPSMFIELFDGLLGLVEKVVELFVPSLEQVEELKASLQLLVDDLTGKFDFVLEPVNQIKNVYSQPKNIYDLTIEYDGQIIYVVPSFLKKSLDKLKVLLNGSLVLFTFISIYKRFVGREDVIK